MDLLQYIESATPAVRDSVRELRDIDFDSYNDEGSNGYVLFGRHSLFRLRVAVKFYYYGEDSHEEVKLVKRISHKNILKVWDAHTIADGWAYFITDELHNGNIDDLLSQSNINTIQALSITRGILCGVGALHSSPNYIIHRDLKPANILIDDNMQPVIADFGSIKRMPENAIYVNASEHSVLYRPPESCEESQYYYSSDIYQIGLVLYQLLGGYLPYNPTCYMSAKQKREHQAIEDRYDQCKYEDDILFKKAQKGKLINLMSLPAFTDKKIIKIIKKATSPDHNDRYQTTADFIYDLYKLGTIPNWIKKEDELHCEYFDNTYRICMKDNRKYIIEKSNYAGKWSKMRNTKLCDSKKEAIEHLVYLL